MTRGRWSAVLFDLDGTLADTLDLIVRCFRHTFQVHRGTVPPDAAFRAGIGMPLREQLRAFTDDPDEVERMAATYAAVQLDLHDGMVAPYPGAVELVRALRDDGTPVAVVTSKRHGMAERTLERCGFAGLYDVLVGADDVARGKPHPEPVLLALDRLGVDGAAARALMVGDAPFDLRAGRGAGTRTAGVLWGAFPAEVLEAEEPDWLVAAPGDLLALGPDA